MHVSAIQPQPRMSPLRIYTHNIFSGDAQRHRRQQLLTTGIHALDPDLLLLQQTMVTNTHDQVANRLGHAYQIVHSRTRDDCGVSISSRWPLPCHPPPGPSPPNPTTASTPVTKTARSPTSNLAPEHHCTALSPS